MGVGSADTEPEPVTACPAEAVKALTQGAALRRASLAQDRQERLLPGVIAEGRC